MVALCLSTIVQLCAFTCSLINLILYVVIYVIYNINVILFSLIFYYGDQNILYVLYCPSVYSVKFSDADKWHSISHGVMNFNNACHCAIFKANLSFVESIFFLFSIREC